MFVFCAQSPMHIRSKYHSELDYSIYTKEINSLDKRVYNMLDYFDKSFYHDTTQAITYTFRLKEVKSQGLNLSI